MSTTADAEFEVIVGTYEHFLVGYTYKDEDKKLTNSFAVEAHKGSVKCIASTSQYVVSGGTDEIISIYDLVERKEVCNLMHHTGTVSSVQFTPDATHLITTGLDGTLSIIRCGSWSTEKIWHKAHNGAGICSVAVHPSGKMAMSLAQNKSLKTWNLLKGRVAYTTNLSSLAKFIDNVLWSTKGKYYAIPSENRIFIFDTNIAGVICSIYCSTRISTFSFIEEGVICFGEEEGWIIGYDVVNDTKLWQLKTGDSRIKCLACVSAKWIVSCASTGELTVWRIREAKRRPQKRVSVNIGSRPTCITVRIPPVGHISD